MPSGGAQGGDGGGGGDDGGGTGGGGGNRSGGNGPAGSSGSSGGGGNGSPDAMPDAAPANPHATCIMPLGDSITQADLQNLSYRYWLWKQLTDKGYKFGFVGSVRTRELRDPKKAALPFPNAAFDVDHQGHWGKKPTEILSILKTIATWEKQTPGIVLLHAGTNEIWTLGSDGVDVVKERVAAGLGQLIDFVRTKNANVVVLMAKIIPLDSVRFGGGVQDAINAINAQIAMLAANKNTVKSPVLIVDQATGFEDTDLLPDGIHPNEAGEKKMAAKWFSAVEPHVKAPALLPCPL